MKKRKMALYSNKVSEFLSFINVIDYGLSLFIIKIFSQLLFYKQ